MIESVLTVCIGNICRSPTAQALLSHQLPGLKVTSAGLQALDGRGIDPPMLAMLEGAGLRPSPHSARSLSSWMLAQSDLVLVMDTHQRSHIERVYPTSRGRVFRLCEHIGPRGLDVPDPYMQDMDTCKHVFTLIEEGVHRWSERIQALGYTGALTA